MEGTDYYYTGSMQKHDMRYVTQNALIMFAFLSVGGPSEWYTMTPPFLIIFAGWYPHASPPHLQQQWSTSDLPPKQKLASHFSWTLIPPKKC
jgi:hypothetical protein